MAEGRLNALSGWADVWALVKDEPCVNQLIDYHCLHFARGHHQRDRYYERNSDNSIDEEDLASLLSPLNIWWGEVLAPLQAAYEPDRSVLLDAVMARFGSSRWPKHFDEASLKALMAHRESSAIKDPSHYRVFIEEVIQIHISYVIIL